MSEARGKNGLHYLKNEFPLARKGLSLRNGFKSQQ